MPTTPRNYRAEYQRRIAKGVSRGLSLSQARGHRQASEAPLSPKAVRPIDEATLQRALRALRTEQNLKAAAQASNISQERLKRISLEKGLIERSGRRWQIKAELPRQMLVFSEGKSVPVILKDFESASLAGRYMAAVGKFLETNNAALLEPFKGLSVTDRNGKSIPLETNPNELYRIAAAGDHSFESIYRIVI